MQREGERESCASSRQDEKAVDLPLVGSSTATQQGLCPQLATSPRIPSLSPPLLPSSKCCHVVLFLWLSCSCCRCCCCCCLLLMLLFRLQNEIIICNQNCAASAPGSTTDSCPNCLLSLTDPVDSFLPCSNNEMIVQLDYASGVLR